MKKIKYELIKLSEAISADPIYKEYLKDTDPDYKYITGIMFVKYAGAGNTIRLGFDTPGGRLFNLVPIELWDIDLQYRTSDELFLPVNIPAAGSTFKAYVEAVTVVTALKGDVILRLENEPRKEIGFNFQHRQLTHKANNLTIESLDIPVDSGYKKIRGIWSNMSSLCRIAIKKGGDYAINPLPHKNFKTGVITPYQDRFFPTNIESKIVTVETELLTVSGADVVFDVVFLLEK